MKTVRLFDIKGQEIKDNDKVVIHRLYKFPVIGIVKDFNNVELEKISAYEDSEVIPIKDVISLCVEKI